MYIDTHAHILKEYYPNIEEIIKKAKENQVTKIIISGCNKKSNLEIIKLIDKYDILYGTIGFHPTELECYQESDLEWLKQNINHKKIVAIGEIGLDYHYENTDKNLQQKVFISQLSIAQEMNKPVVIHSRDSIQDTYDILSKYNTKGVLHCYSGSKEMAQGFIKLNYLLGVGGIITYKNANNIKEVIKNIDLAYILLETDSPYLSPEPKRDQLNSPANIPLIASKIAEIKGITTEEVAKVTNNNAKRLFDFYE